MTILNLGSNLTPTGNGNDTTLDGLQTYAMPGGTLSTIGQGILIQGWGTFNSNTHTKTLTFNFGSQTILTHSASVFNGQSWMFLGKIIKTAANAQIITGTLYVSGMVPFTYTVTGSQNDGSTINIEILGQTSVATADDVVCSAMLVETVS